MKDFYKQFLLEIDDIAESKTLYTAKFTYGFISGRVCLARELNLISADQMAHILKVAEEALDDWITFFQ